MEVRLHSFLAMALVGGEWWSSCCGHFTPEKNCSVPTEQESRRGGLEGGDREKNSSLCLLLNHTLPVCSLVNKINFCFHFCCCRNDFLHSCVQNAAVLFCSALKHPMKWHAVTVDTVTVSVVRYKMHSKHMLCITKVCIKCRTLAYSAKFRINQAGCCWPGSVPTAQVMEYRVRDFYVVFFLLQVTSVTASRILCSHHLWPSFHPSEFCLISAVESTYS